MNSLTARQRENCRILAEEILPHIKNSNFDMSDFTYTPTVPTAEARKHHCGAVGCALGWASMSGKIDGLSYALVGYDENGERVYLTDTKGGDFNHAVPLTRHGSKWVRKQWRDIGERFFGHTTYNNVFTGRGEYKNKQEIIAALLRLSRGEWPYTW